MMTQLYTSDEIIRMKKKKRCLMTAAASILAAALLACTVLCFHVTGANATRLFALVAALFTLAGWTAIVLVNVFALPAGAWAKHAEGILACSGEEMTGVISSPEQVLRIPKSIWIRKVSLDCGEQQVLLSLPAAKARLLPPAGSTVRVMTARKYIVSFEVLHE